MRKNRRIGAWNGRSWIAVLCLQFSVFAQFSICDAQRVLSLDSCRQMALRNNKQLGISKLKQNVAANIRKSARTKYLPHVSAIGTYQFTSEEISLLSETQKQTIGNIGSIYGAGMQESMGKTLAQLPQPQFSQMLAQMGLSMEGLQQLLGENTAETSARLNAFGQQIVDDFRTDTRNIFAGSILLTQPIFMGGSIIALNKIADLGEDLAENSMEARRQATLYKIDQTYWQVVSLCHKKKLAEGYLDLVKKLDTDVHKMIDEGVATKSDGLSVDVRVNEAEMTLTKVNDGLILSRMLLNQLCGLPLD